MRQIFLKIFSLLAILAAVISCRQSSLSEIEKAYYGSDIPYPEEQAFLNANFEGIEAITAISSSRVQITISPPPKTSGNPDYSYRVYLDRDLVQTHATYSSEVLTLSESGKYELIVTRLDPGSDFEFLVRASFKNIIEDDNQNWKSVRTLGSDTDVDSGSGGSGGGNLDLPVFAGLNLAAIQGNDVRLSWSAATDNDTNSNQIIYKIFRSTTSLGFDFSAPLSQVTGSVTYLDATPVANSVNYYLVRAYDAAGNSDGNYFEKTAGVYDAIVFAGLASATPTSQTSVLLRATPPTGGSSSYTYRVYKNGDYSNVFASFGGPGPDQDGLMSFAVTGLSMATAYTFSMRVYDGIKEEKNVVSIGVSTLAYLAPSFSGALNVVPLAGLSGQTRLKVSWAAATAASGSMASYEIYLRTSAASFNLAAPITIATSTATEVTLTGLNSASTYFVIVRATDDSGRQDKNLSERSGSTTSSAAISFAGVQSAVLATGAAGFTGITAYWSAATGDFNQYLVFVSTTNLNTLSLGDAFWSTPTAIFDSTLVSGAINSLSANTLYYIVVRASNSNTLANDGNRSATTITTLPNAPAFDGLQSVSRPAGTDGLTQLVLGWNAATGAFNRYRIFQKTAGTYNYASPVGILSPPATSYIVTGLTTDTQYCFVVRAVYDAVAPILQETNTTEICGTPAYTPPTFTGLGGCQAVSGGPGVSTLQLTWSAATGIYDKYAIWGPSSSPVSFSVAENQLIDGGLLLKQISGLTPNTTYYFGMRARYTSNGGEDSNTMIRSCATSKAYLIFSQTTDGLKDSGNHFLTKTKVCIQDNAGNSAGIDRTITLSLGTGAGSLLGTLSKASTSGCASFNDLGYLGSDQMTFVATAANAVTAESSHITPFQASDPPLGACAIETASWITAYGGCYNPTTKIVVSSEAGSALSFQAATWEAFPDLSDVDLHDYRNDADADGLPDDMDASGSVFGAIHGDGAYCHDLVEGGYIDWRLPRLSDLQNIRSVAGSASSLSFQPGTNYYWSSKAASPYSGYQYKFRFTDSSLLVANTSEKLFCVRDAETNFATPELFNDLTATVPGGAAGAGSVALSWTGAIGNFQGYQIFWAPSSESIDYNNPQKILKKPANSYTVNGLKPSTEYRFALRAIWTNRLPIVTDGNTDEVLASTNSAYLAFHLFEGYPLATGTLPVVVKVLETGSGGLATSDAVTVTLSKIAGSGVLGGTLTASSVGGYAKFTGVTYSATDTLTLRASSSSATSADSGPTQVVAVTPGACLDFTVTGSIKPSSGGCLVGSSNLILSLAGPNVSKWSDIVWEDNALGTSAKISDVNDADSDGRLDEIDPTGTRFNPASNGYCHDLIEGGKTDWRVPTYLELANLAPSAFWDYSSYITGRNYWSSKSTGDDTTHGWIYKFPGTALVDSYSAYALCVRNP